MPPKKRKAGAAPAKSRKKAAAPAKQEEEIETPVPIPPPEETGDRSQSEEVEEERASSTRASKRRKGSASQDVVASQPIEVASTAKAPARGKRGRPAADESTTLAVTEESVEERGGRKVTKKVRREEGALPEGKTVAVTVETVTVEKVPVGEVVTEKGEQSAKEKLAERMKKLQDLKKLRSESQKANREDVKAEFRKKQENPKEAIRQERKRDKAATLLAKETADLGGQDYERLRSMNYSIEDVERWEEKEREKEENADKGFTDHAQVQARKYNNLIRSLKPNLDTYTDQKAHAHIDAAGDNAFFPDANSLAYANPEVKTSSQGVQRVVADLKKQNEKRATFSRRREFNEDDDVTYINERNMHFNKKISRAYDKYTAEIKANFERGTAL